MSLPTPGPAGRAGLVFVILTVFLDMLGIGLLVPVLPFLVRQFRSDALTLGWLSMSYAAAQFVATPVLGSLSDRLGRRPILILSIAGSGLAYIAFGLATALWVMFAARIIDGLTGGNISTAQAYIADITPPEQRSKTMGLLGAALGLGFIIGPAVGGALSRISLQTPALAAGALALANSTFGWWVLRESLPAERRTRDPITRRLFNPFRALRHAVTDLGLRPLLTATFLGTFALAGLQSNFALFTLTRLGYGPSQASVVFVFLGAMHILTQGLLVRRAVAWWGDRRTLVVGLALSAGGYAGLATTHSAPMLFAVVGVIAVGGGLATPTLTALISGRSTGQEQGATLGSAQATAALARIAGPLWAGFVFDSAGSGYPYGTGALCILGALAAVVAAGPDTGARRATATPETPRPDRITL